MSVFYSNTIEGNIIQIFDDEHKHCMQVLRHKIGDIIKVVDGKGHLFECQISVSDKNKTTATINSMQIFDPPKIQKCIGIPPTKNLARIEWFIEKAVEIGITNIIIYATKRTERKIHNHERINKIIISAMKQSQQYFLPTIIYTKSINEGLEKVSTLSQKFIAHCADPLHSLMKKVNKNEDCVVFIGPEGDFTQEEVQLCLEDGFKEISLGNNRLRTETAGLVALMMMT